MDSTSTIPPWEELYRYWLNRHVDGKPPMRSGIDPMIDLRHMASNLLLIDAYPGRSEYRLVGSQVVTFFGVDHTGKQVGTSDVDKTQLKAWRRAVDFVAHENKPYLLASHYPGAKKSKTIALLLPLTPDADGAVKLFGATFFDGPFPDTGAYPDLIVEKVEIDL